VAAEPEPELEPATETTDLWSRVVALEVEVVVTQLVAEVASRALSELGRSCN
jgi:hypothetical protein